MKQIISFYVIYKWKNRGTRTLTLDEDGTRGIELVLSFTLVVRLTAAVAIAKLQAAVKTIRELVVMILHSCSIRSRREKGYI